MELDEFTEMEQIDVNEEETMMLFATQNQHMNVEHRPEARVTQGPTALGSTDDERRVNWKSSTQTQDKDIDCGPSERWTFFVGVILGRKKMKSK